MSPRNEFLDHGSSEESDVDVGYDSDAAEASKASRQRHVGSRSSKRRKLSHASSESEDDIDATFVTAKDEISPVKSEITQKSVPNPSNLANARSTQDESDYEIKSAAKAVQDVKSRTASSKAKEKKEKIPGVIYLSSLPPYLKPSALRNLLVQRGFGPITRLFLTPASKHKHSSKKNSRQLYTEGWIEFENKKTARRCADALNAQLVGGRKGGFYHDDLWNMKYLKGMSWDELMAGIREEKREEEGRRDEERRRLAAETKAFVEGVEQGRKVQGMQKKRKAKAGYEDNEKVEGVNETRRTWRQFEVADSKKQRPGTKAQTPSGIGQEVQQVLSKIF